MPRLSVAPEVRADLLAAVALARPHAAALDRAALEQLLYTAWFTGATGAVESAPAEFGTTLAARLRAAHAATARFEPGWTARQVGAGGILVAERGGEQLHVQPPDYLNLGRPAAPVRPGDALAVTARRDWTDTDGAWWVTSAGAGPPPGHTMARVYWNCPPRAVTALVAAVTGALEPRRVPYTLKCPLSEELFDRIEPVVLYLGVDEWESAKPALRDAHAALADRLRPAVPPLSLRLGAGAAAAEDPGDGRSFGQSRAAAVADGIATAAERGIGGDDATIAVLAERLEAHDIAPERPYLRAGSPPDLIAAW